MEGNYLGRMWTTWFLWAEGVKLSDIHRRLSAICGEKAPAGSTVINCVRSFKCGKETVREWHRDTAKEWFGDANRKLPGK